jgi:hypothetical protein
MEALRIPAEDRAGAGVCASGAILCARSCPRRVSSHHPRLETEAFMRNHTLVGLAILALSGCGDPKDKNSGGPGGTSSGTNGATGTSGGSSGGTGGSAGGSAACSPSSPGSLFGAALCMCGNLHDVGNLIIDGNGPGTSASAAVDGISRLINHTDVGDTFSAYGGLNDAGYTAVHKNLLSSTDVDVAGNLEVAGDLAVGGNLSGIGRIQVGGTLRVAGTNNMLGLLDAPTRGNFSPLGAPPCPCDPAGLFDVSGAVVAAHANSSTVTLASQPTGTIGVNPITLQTGAYYSADAATIGLERLHITGAVQLFVDGALDEIGADRIVIDPGATLDLYVSKGVNTVGYAGLGDWKSPASFRLYVGGDAPVTVSVGAEWFHGSIYAPKANIVYVGDTHVEGGLFCNELVGTGQLVIGGALPGGGGSGTSCPPTPPSSPPVTPTPPVG